MKIDVKNFLVTTKIIAMTTTPTETRPAAPKRSRGRPPGFDRHRAVQTAMALFLKRGYQGTSVSDLVEAMGLSPPSLYAAFGSKEGLYREVLGHYVEGRGRFVSKALAVDQPVEEQVRQILRDAATTFTPVGEDAPGCMVSGDLIMFTPDNASVANHVRELREVPRRAVAERIRWAQSNGQMPPSVNADALARFFSAVVTGMAVQAKDGASREDLLAMAAQAMAAWPRETGQATKPEKSRPPR